MTNASGVDQNNLSKIEGLLQTNNDIVLAIHKSFMQSTMEVNRKIVSLTINNESQMQISSGSVGVTYKKNALERHPGWLT